MEWQRSRGRLVVPLLTRVTCIYTSMAHRVIRAGDVVADHIMWLMMIHLGTTVLEILCVRWEDYMMLTSGGELNAGRINACI